MTGEILSRAAGVVTRPIAYGECVSSVSVLQNLIAYGEKLVNRYKQRRTNTVASLMPVRRDHFPGVGIRSGVGVGVGAVWQYVPSFIITASTGSAAMTPAEVAAVYLSAYLHCENLCGHVPQL